MTVEKPLAFVDAILFSATGKHLTDLQTRVVQLVLEGKRYVDIADIYGCTEGHAKDVGAQLWQSLSLALGERVTKGNLRTVLNRRLADGYPEGDAGDVASGVSQSQVCIDLGRDPNRDPDRDPDRDSKIFAREERYGLLGRDRAIAQLDRLVHRGARVIVIQGEGGVGKTTLAHHYLQQHFRPDSQFQQPGQATILEVLMATEPQDITPVEHIVEEWLQQDLNVEPGQEFGITLGRLKRQLQIRRVGVLIDNLEPALDRDGRFLQEHRRYGTLLRILADPSVQSVTLITSRDRLCEGGGAIHHLRLGGLEETDWQQYFLDYPLTVNGPILKAMHHTYGGNAKAMGILCGLIQTDFDGDMTLYWQTHQEAPLTPLDLKNLVASQFNRLQSLDPWAYQLLCRLGVYRYQVIPKVPLDGLSCLLWDFTPGQHPVVIGALRNRSLVEVEGGQYGLHPMIRAEAIARLRQQEDWEETHRRAAQFWTHTITTIQTRQDALTALEAYYHALEIQDFELAAQVLLHSRNNQWQQFLPLGSTLYRLGLVQPVLSAIPPILAHLPPSPRTAELHNILGDLHWIRGDIHPAIACQEETITIATHHFHALDVSGSEPEAGNSRTAYYLKMLEIDSLLSLGLYHIDLWELPKATAFFERVMALAHQTPHHRWAEKAAIGYALVQSYRGESGQAIALAAPLYDKVLVDTTGLYTGRFAYFIQLLCQIYGNVGAFSDARELGQRAIAYARNSQFLQVEAKTLNSLAIVERQEGQWEAAIAYHTQAIALLDTLGARCDLAEAYFQYGITQLQGSMKLQGRTSGEEALEQAIQLFQATCAPNQVAKVEQALASWNLSLPASVTKK